MREIKAPCDWNRSPGEKVLFIAGSIEMDNAPNWQADLVQLLSDVPGILLNPRRDDWDSNWVQSLQDSRFVEQVEWELHGLNEADLVSICFDANSYAPISLLELGLLADKGRCVVYCPDGFWRKGNVDVVCRWYGIRQVSDLVSLSNAIRSELLAGDN